MGRCRCRDTGAIPCAWLEPGVRPRSATLREQPNLFFDTAWWSPADLLALLTLVPPGQLLFGSDAPYGTTAAAATVAIRCALHAGLGPEQITAIAGGQLERLLAGADPLDLGPPPPNQRRRPRRCSSGSSSCWPPRWDG